MTDPGYQASDDPANDPANDLPNAPAPALDADSLSFRHAWITGASSGIGEALALRLARTGVTLTLSGRAHDRLEAVARRCEAVGATCRTLAFDLGDPAARTESCERLGDDIDTIDLFINNAGVSMRSPAIDAPFALDRAIVEVDFLAGVELAKRLLPGMIAARRGILCTVSSVAGLAPVPLRSAYNAAKAAQLAYFGTLGNELTGTGVSVTTVIAGFVRTNVSQAALTSGGTAWGRLDPNQAGGLDPDRAAELIVGALRRRRRRYWVGMTPKLWAMVGLARCAPRILDRILARAEVT